MDLLNYYDSDPPDDDSDDEAGVRKPLESDDSPKNETHSRRRRCREDTKDDVTNSSPIKRPCLETDSKSSSLARTCPNNTTGSSIPLVWYKDPQIMALFQREQPERKGQWPSHVFVKVPWYVIPNRHDKNDLDHDDYDTTTWTRRRRRRRIVESWIHQDVTHHVVPLLQSYHYTGPLVCHYYPLPTTSTTSIDEKHDTSHPTTMETKCHENDTRLLPPEKESESESSNEDTDDTDSLHISLSRPFYLQGHNKQSFLQALRRELHVFALSLLSSSSSSNNTSLCIDWCRGQWLVNDTKTRSFWVYPVTSTSTSNTTRSTTTKQSSSSSSSFWLQDLVTKHMNVVLQRFGQPLYDYEPLQFHVSVASIPTDIYALQRHSQPNKPMAYSTTTAKPNQTLFRPKAWRVTQLHATFGTIETHVFDL